MTPARRSLVVPLVLAAALAGPLALAASSVLRHMGVDRPYDVRYIPEGRALRFLSPGLKLSIADAYWLATVQYVGDQYLSNGTYDRLFPLVDLVTDLDPAHGYAYQTAGIVLSSSGRIEESDRILKKGMEPGRPAWWSYPFYLAFNDFFYRGDYASAARWARVAARTPGASTNISQLALSLEVKSGDPGAAVDFLAEMRKATHDERSAAALEEQYRIAVLQRDFARLDAAVARFREERGRDPSSLDEVRRAGYLDAIPVEPFGGRYELRADGKVHSTGRDFRFQPPEAPRPLPSAGVPNLLRRPPEPSGEGKP